MWTRPCSGPHYPKGFFAKDEMVKNHGVWIIDSLSRFHNVSIIITDIMVGWLLICMCGAAHWCGKPLSITTPVSKNLPKHDWKWKHLFKLAENGNNKASLMARMPQKFPSPQQKPLISGIVTWWSPQDYWIWTLGWAVFVMIDYYCWASFYG